MTETTKIKMEEKRIVKGEDVYATIKTDLYSVTFWSRKDDYEENLKKYSLQLEKEHNSIQKSNDFKSRFLEECKSNIQMISDALKQGISVFYNYDLMGCFEVISMTSKRVKIEDICGNVRYLKHNYFDGLVKDAFSFNAITN